MLQQHTQAAPALPVNRLTQFDPRPLLRRAWAANRFLTLLGVLMLATLAISILGLVFDPRTITGVPAWLKPFKFSLSIAIYAFTLVWMLGFVEGKRWIVRGVSAITFAMLVGEMVIVILQVVRGTTSHFNATTPFDTTLFSIMGAMIMVVWMMNLVIALLLLFQHLPDPAVAWALRLGLFVSLLGAASGMLMVRPTPAQQAARAAGQHVDAIGAHSVGVEDGGPGLPIVGWSTTGGDLRIGHFIGLHALQALPIVGWLLTRRRTRRLGNRRRVALVFIAGLGYLGLMALAIWQALRGQPLLAPDLLTLAAFAGLVGAVGLAAGAVLANSWRTLVSKTTEA